MDPPGHEALLQGLVIEGAAQVYSNEAEKGRQSDSPRGLDGAKSITWFYPGENWLWTSDLQNVSTLKMCCVKPAMCEDRLHSSQSSYCGTATLLHKKPACSSNGQPGERCERPGKALPSFLFCSVIFWSQRANRTAMGVKHPGSKLEKQGRKPRLTYSQGKLQWFISLASVCPTYTGASN